MSRGVCAAVPTSHVKYLFAVYICICRESARARTLAREKRRDQSPWRKIWAPTAKSFRASLCNREREKEKEKEKEKERERARVSNNLGERQRRQQ